MSGIDHSHVKDMAKLIAAMNAVDDAPTGDRTHKMISENDLVHARSSGTITPDTSAMARIMAAFNAATDDIVAGSDTYPELKKALVTEATETGARVGSWEISGRTIEGMGKFYDVKHISGNDLIASDLRLYEAALALVNALNEGSGINSMRVKHILTVEEEYSRALTDAVQFSARMKMTEGVQHNVAEARYSNAKQRAMIAKRSLSNITKLF